MAQPRVMISAIKSGAGKTTITCGMLAALKKIGKNPSAFKCGPDYIDPLFHREIIGTKGCNLDLFFVENDILKQLFCAYSKDTDISIIEGVMGFYDGVLGTTSKASACDVSNVLDVPVILAVDVKGASLTTCAVINGIKNFEKNHISGVILNNCSEKMYTFYKEMIEQNCEIEVLGYLPKNAEYSIESRHLGLVTAEEIENLKSKLDLLADTMLKTIDVKRILEIACLVDDIKYIPQEITKITEKKPRIAVAKDKAFCFYYKENLDLFEKLGAQIVYFSPLEDQKLPQNIQGIYIGGGYPELYLEKLSKNKSMLIDIKKHIGRGTVTFAECGGFMYLLSDIEGYSMVNAIEGSCFNAKKLTRFGYIDLIANEENIFCKARESIKAHEFHYYDSTNNGSGFDTKKRNITYKTTILCENLLAGFPHLYFYSNINFAKNFIKKMEESNGKSI